MKRILSIDFGKKRCGIAVTDTLQLVANGLTTVRTCDLESFVKEYTAKEPVDAIVVGKPTTMKGDPSESMRYLSPGINRLRSVLPDNIQIIMWDERFTSVIAHRSMLDSGMKKTRRQDKAVVDEIAAAIILNDYLQSKSYSR